MGAANGHDVKSNGALTFHGPSGLEVMELPFTEDLRRHPPAVNHTVATVLSQPSMVLIFAYAPAGLGHLRVTDALRRGLPPEVSPILLGANDVTIDYLHRIASLHPALRAAFEWVQRGTPEDVFTTSYRLFLRSRTKALYQQMRTILGQRVDRPRTVLVIATHFGLAHQLAALKERLLQEQVRLVVVVQVTDDSPQHIWYVPGADLILAPSEHTRARLLRYGRETGLGEVPIEVAPYPVNPSLAEPLTPDQTRLRLAQLEPAGTVPIEMSLPVSGAAVGMAYSTALIEGLRAVSPRFQFQLVSRINPFTQPFLHQMMRRTFVEVHASPDDREVVQAYDEMYRRHIIGLEVTKPSEQAFKALLRPDQRGGAILLFSKPVGRQEYDNLDFLRRHQLMPGKSDRNRLWEHARQRTPLRGSEGKRLRRAARGWRALELPNDAAAAVEFIRWSLEERLLASMGACRAAPREGDQHAAAELSGEGVRLFWERVARYLATEPHAAHVEP